MTSVCGPTHAMILAAGRGTRLGELGRSVPKVLVEVGGEPLLARQLRYLLEDGPVERVVVNAHHLAPQIERFVAEHPRADAIDVVVEPSLLGTAGGVRNALPLLGDEPFAVLYGDVLIDEPLAELAATHRRAGAAATLTLYRTSEIEGKGTVELTAGGAVQAFNEKSAAAQLDGEAYVNAGLYMLDPDLMSRFPEGIELDFGHDVFPAALAAGVQIAGHVLAERVIDMGTPAMLALARDGG